MYVEWTSGSKWSALKGTRWEGTGFISDTDNAGVYGGLLFAYNEQKVRMWAPTKNDGAWGSIIAIFDGTS